MKQLKEFINTNRILIMILSFAVTMYVQHVTNTAQITQLTSRCAILELRITDQYDKIDAIKLDKAVFEATMTQFTIMHSDLREMRTDIKELLKNASKKR